MVHRIWNIGPLVALFMLLILAACAPPSGLPEGPTPIPTLIPVTQEQASTEPTEPSFAILSYPVRPPSALEGGRIFAEHCAECHGEDGTGKLPGSRNFQDLDYMRGEAPVYFYAAVTEGRGDMPNYKDILSSDERWDVVSYVWRHSTTAETLKTGQEIFNENCATCHGENGSGELLGSADFTDLRQMDQIAPRDLYLTITQGRGSMPAWQSLLNQDERWAVIDYLRTFTYEPTLLQEIGAASPSEPEETVPPAEIACSTEQTNPFAWEDEEAIGAGSAIYQGQCAMCHGPDGSGGLPNTPDFTSADISNDLKSSPGRYFCSVKDGKEIMPPFGESLSMDQLWQVLTFIGSFGP